jgi:putative transposase
VKVVASTVWEILCEAAIDPVPERGSATWADFLRSQAEAVLVCDFFEAVTLSGARLHVLAVIEHASRRIRILSATARPTASWVAQAARNLAMDLEDAGCRARFLIRDRDGKFPGLFDVILADAGIKLYLAGPDAKDELDHGTVGADLPARAPGPHADLEPVPPPARLTGVRAVLQRAPAAPGHRQRPLQPLPAPLAAPDQIASLDIRRRDRLGGVLHKYRHAA